MNRKIFAADLFCGAGGTSAGLYKAADEPDIDVDLLAVNHWDIAIATHSTNHREATHLCESLDGVNPRKVVPSGHLDLLVASPECIGHSRARGGKPINDQCRASAWHVLRWAEALDIPNILIENVKEFVEWAPLGANGRPLKSRRGETFQAFITSLRSLGYSVDYKILNAADHGDPTTRERLFIIARKGRRKIEWPIPTHSKTGETTLFGRTKKWRAAREIVDWTLPGKSIFGRKKPLALNTLRRIWAGLQKFCPGIASDPALAQPFLVMLYGTNDARSIDLPCPTVTATGNHIAVAEPFIFANRTNNTPKSTGDPVPTLCTGNHIALVEPFIMHTTHHGKRRTHSTKEPLPTVTGARRGEMALVETSVGTLKDGDKIIGRSCPKCGTVMTVKHITCPCCLKVKWKDIKRQPLQSFICSAGGPNVGPRSVEDPMNTVLTRDHMALVEPFLLQTDQTGSNGSCVRSLNRPVGTVITKQNMALVEPFVIGQQSCSAARSTKKPLMTVAGKGAIGLVEPYLVRYNGTGKSESIGSPMPTLTAKDRFGLSQPFIVPFFGERNGQKPRVHSTKDPLPTVTSHGAGALVDPIVGAKKNRRGKKVVHYLLDIRFRMLQPHELAAAMSFDRDYRFTGNREAQVKQIGNAVPVRLAKALCVALLKDEAKSSRGVGRTKMAKAA